MTSNTFAKTCEDYYQKNLESLLSLSLKDFNQHFATEFQSKIFKNNYCYKEKAQIFEDYYYASESSQESLKKEIAHAWGLVGNYEKAIEWNEKQLEDEKENKPTPWNNYILARIAYFKRDEELFVKHYNIVDKISGDSFGNALLTVWLDMLIEDFDKPYRYIVENRLKEIEQQ
jgi:hypothetical protein